MFSEMEVRHIAAVVRKGNLLEERQRLATGESPKKKRRIILSEEQKVAHAWVAACDAGDLRVVELLLPVVDRGVRYIDEKLSKADKSVFLKLSTTYRYRKMEMLKLSKNYRCRKIHQIWSDQQ